MFKHLKTYFHSMNEMPYIKVRDRLEFISRDKDYTKLDHIEMDMRTKNFKIYTRNIFKLSWILGKVYALPVIALISGGVGIAKDIHKTDKITEPVYEKVETVITDKDAYYEEISTEKYIATGKTIVGECDYKQLGYTPSLSIEYILENDINSMVFDINVSPNGKLSLSNSSSGQFVNLEDVVKNNPNNSELPEEYKNLLKKLREVAESGSVNSNKIKEMEKSENFYSSARIIDYREVSQEEFIVLKYSSTGGIHYALYVVGGIVVLIIVLIATMDKNDYSIILTCKDGKLVEISNWKKSTPLDLYRYRTLFDLAEEQRVKQLAATAEELLNEESVKMVLKPYKHIIDIEKRDR